MRRTAALFGLAVYWIATTILPLVHTTLAHGPQSRPHRHTLAAIEPSAHKHAAHKHAAHEHAAHEHAAHEHAAHEHAAHKHAAHKHAAHKHAAHEHAAHEHAAHEHAEHKHAAHKHAAHDHHQGGYPGDPSHGAGALEHFGVALLGTPLAPSISLAARCAVRLVPAALSRPGRFTSPTSIRSRAPPHA